MVSRFVTVLITVIATYWYGLTRTWEAFFTAAGFFVVYLSTETFGVLRSKKRVAADSELFKRLQTELPFESSIRFLRDHDLRVAFRWSSLADLSHFVETWTDESHKFHDKQLERAKESLRVIAIRFLSDLATNTFSREYEDVREIPNEWMINQQERYKEVSDRLNNGADDVVRKHQTLFELARRKLDL